MISSEESGLRASTSSRKTCSRSDSSSFKNAFTAGGSNIDIKGCFDSMGPERPSKISFRTSAIFSVDQGFFLASLLKADYDFSSLMGLF